MTQIEPIKILNTVVRLWSDGNQYHFSFVIDDETYKDVAPNRDGAIAFAHRRIEECKKEKKSTAT